MTQPATAHVITANALLDGDVIYLTPHDTWTRDLAAAEILTDEAHAQVRLIDASARNLEAVGVYLAQVSRTPQGPQPQHLRERFRATGPSNYHHGKQERA